MSSTNQGPEYFAAEKRYLQAQTNDERIKALEDMLRNFKKHKGSENMEANIKQRLKKFIEKKEKTKKVGKSTIKSIKKEGFQCCLIGMPNSGKSALLSKLTNVTAKYSPVPFSTKEPVLGTFQYQGIKTQMIDMPSIGSEGFDIGVVNTADLLLVVITSLDELEKINPVISRAYGQRLIVVNKADTLSSDKIRKLEATIKSKKLNAIIVSAFSEYNLEKLKSLIMQKTGFIRIYMKEPSKPHSPIPLVLHSGASVKQAANSIRNGLANEIKESRITGPSSKFPNQKVGLAHILKDQDIIEFHYK